MRKSLIFTICLIFPFLSSCQSNNGCGENLEHLKLYNSDHKRNLGLEYTIIDKKEDLDYICSEFDKMEQVYPITTNHNKGYIDIMIRPTDNLFFEEKITLIFTVKKGNIFRMQDGLHYKNDELVKFLIKSLKIKDVSNYFSVE